jgi:hypothetical protein
MSKPIPPRLATWLIEQLGRGSKTQSLIGDLSEQYAEGRSASWYWRQILAALAIEFADSAREHGLSFASAVVLAYAAVHVSDIPGPVMRHLLVRMWGFSWQWQWHGWARFPLSVALLCLPAGVQLLAGWLVAKVDRHHPRAALTTLAFLLALSGLCNLVRDARGLSMQVPGADVRHDIDVLLILFMGVALPIHFALAGGLLTLRTRSHAPGTRLDWVLASVVALPFIAGALVESFGPGILVGSGSSTLFDLLWIARLAALSYLVQRWWRAFPTSHGRQDSHPDQSVPQP